MKPELADTVAAPERAPAAERTATLGAPADRLSGAMVRYRTPRPPGAL